MTPARSATCPSPPWAPADGGSTACGGVTGGAVAEEDRAGDCLLRLTVFELVPLFSRCTSLLPPPPPPPQLTENEGEGGAKRSPLPDPEDDARRRA